MGVMESDRESCGGAVDKEILVSKIVDSILGKRRTWEGPLSIVPPGPSAEEVTKEVPADVSLRKLRQIYSRAVKSKVAARQYLDVSGSDSEFVESEDESQSRDDAKATCAVEREPDVGDDAKVVCAVDREPESKDDAMATCAVEREPESGDDAKAICVVELEPECKDDPKAICTKEPGSDDRDSSEPAGGSKKQKQQDNVCDQCGITVKKPALLIQHKRTHSEQRPFVCPRSDCGSAYKRQDHLNRHLKKHQGVAFFCPQPGCDQAFTLQANLQRHVKQNEHKSHAKPSREESYVCSYPDCGKSFRYPSLLRTHESCHDKQECTEFFCMYPGCGDMFSCEKTLVTHAETAHPYLLCEVCGETIPRKSFLRHARTHATKVLRDVVCPYDGCGSTYTRETNLRQHVRSAHLQIKPFMCSHEGCDRKYAHKAARDRHEQSEFHSQPRIDFQDQDELCLSKPRGGRKPVEFEKVARYLRSRTIDIITEKQADD